jgi:eukaryotic-like serine/threonine-protein kinase
MDSQTVVFGRYLLHEQLGAGGTGVVWRATDRLLDQTVALKRVPFATLDDQQAQLTRDRALREARLAAQLRGHPHVIAVYDALVDHGDIWLVMEYLPTRSLHELLATHGRLDPLKAARIGADIADALAAGHTRGIEHRDVKPGNVLITADGTAKLTDYGISHLTGDPHLTHTGITGTPAYLAPEVARDGDSSAASDMFSLGATLYAAVEGQPPFGTDDNTFRLLNRVRTGIIRPPTHAGPLEPLLLRLLHLDPSTRLDAITARDLLTRLATHPAEPDRRSPRQWAWTQRLQWPPRRRTAMAALLAITTFTAVALGLSTLINPNTIDSTTQEPREADPCALLDPGALRPFGDTAFTVPPLLESCAVSITTDNRRAQARVIFEEAGPVSELGDPLRQVDNVIIFGKGESLIGDHPLCKYFLLQADQPLVEIRVDAYEKPVTTDVCAVAAVAAYSVADKLAKNGITYTPDRTDHYALTRSDACTALDSTALGKVPGLDPTQWSAGFANWSCRWGDDEASVDLGFYLYPSPVKLGGEHRTVAGKDMYLERSEGHCRALAVHRPARNAGSATDMFTLDVKAPLPPDQLCNLTTELVAAAQENLP